VKCHVALTPTWSETAWFADYVLPMGVGPSATTWPASRPTPAAGSGSASRSCAATPRSRAASSAPTAAATSSTPARSGRRTSSGSTCRGGSTPTASLGIRKWFESERRARPSRSRSTSTTARCSPSGPRPGRGRRRGRADAARVHARPQRLRGARRHDHPYERRSTRPCLDGLHQGRDGVYRKPGTPGTWDGDPETLDDLHLAPSSVTGRRRRGRRRGQGGVPDAVEEARAVLRPRLADWGWPEYATPKWIPSHVHWEDLDLAGTERILLPTFRIPTSSTPGRRTRSGSTRSATVTRCGSTRATPRSSASRSPASCGSAPASGTS
jgi:hypothetical protein